MRVGKVYHNIEESNFFVEVGRFTFQFSSYFYYLKFNKEIRNYIERESFKLDHKYNLQLDYSEYLALSLYKRIEKRGFSAKFNGNEITPNQTFGLSLTVINKF